MTYAFFLLINFSIWSPVPTGTVDLVTIIFFELIFLITSFAALKTKDRLTSKEFFLFGVPTHRKIISDFFTASFKFEVNSIRSSLIFFLRISSKPGSYIGEIPLLNLSILFLSWSTQMTLLPRSAKQTPLTKPT